MNCLGLSNYFHSIQMSESWISVLWTVGVFSLKFRVDKNGKVNKKIGGIKIGSNTEATFKKTNVIIDFTIPKCTFQVLKIASKLKKKVVIGTTGFTKKEEELIKKFSRKIPILKAGNMSLGINLLMYLTEIASASLGDKYPSDEPVV